jgi:RNA polymerase sigma factor (sigma-70 family)
MSELRGPSDQALLSGEDPDGADFALFYRRHVRTLFAELARHRVDAAAAADVVAETFLSALVSRRSFDGARGTSEAWLLAIMNHRLADHYRRSSRAQRLQERLRAELPPLSDEDHRAYEELVARSGPAAADGALGTAIASLPDTRRRALIARVILEWPYNAIGRALNISEVTARQHVSRGLSALRRDIVD